MSNYLISLAKITLKWEGTKLCTNSEVYQLSNKNLIQLGNVRRVRAARREWGYRDILTYTIYSPDGKELIGTEVTTPTKLNKMKLLRVTMV